MVLRVEIRSEGKVEGCKDGDRPGERVKKGVRGNSKIVRVCVECAGGIGGRG